MAFRSHKKGTLARYRDKIEHERVLQNDIGRAVLDELVGKHILILDGNFYYLDPGQIDRHLGVSWLDLRLHQKSDKLIQFLKAVP